jgi:hypothetical protein
MLGWLAAGLGLVYLLVTWLDPDAISVTGLPSVPNPTGVRGLSHISRQGSLGQGIWIMGFGCLLLAAAGVVVRYRRSAGEERLQLKWFAYAVAVNLVLLAVTTPLAGSGGEAWQVAFSLAVVTGVGLALPVTVGVAVLKYRLYAIDKIISRSVSYAVVTGLVVGVYLGCVALFTKISPFHGSVAVAASVLAAAALFNPLRRRVQAVVDRRFDRARYDAERVVAQFSVQLREQVDLDVLGGDLLGVVHRVLAPEHLALWLNDPVAATATDGPGSDQVPEARL